MKSEEIIVKMWDKWQSWEGEDLDDSHSKKNQKLIFLSSEILGLTTYDEGFDIHFGNMVLETMKQIQNKTTYEYIKTNENYFNYILSCNFMDGWLDWGSSIRGAWFDEFGGKIKPDFALSNIGLNENHILITKGFMEWFINFLEA